MGQDDKHKPGGVSRRGFLQTGAAGIAAWEAITTRAPAAPLTAGSPFRPSGRPRALSQNLYVFEDTCNVYLVKDGDRGLLIDFGSGRMLELAPDLGVAGIDWILHTHHHRDQAQGDAKAVERRIPIAVPAHERHLFEDAENFWRNRRVNHLYSVRNDFFTLTRNVPVARLLHDYETFRWGRYQFLILPSPGHTIGSVTLLAEIDGREVAFVGDLIYAPGKVLTLYDLQYNYAGMEGVDFSVYSLTRLLERRPGLVCPSHGEPLADPAPAIQELIRRLSDWYDYWRGPTMITRNRPIVVSPHLVAHHLPVSSFYAVISDSGKALFLDYGSASNTSFLVFKDWPDPFDRMRFLEHSIAELRAGFGMQSIDVAMPSHVHDDHINGFPHLMKHYGTRVWCYENMRDILEHPRGRNIGCVLPEPIPVDRTFRHRETFKWEEFEFTVVHSPGHTEFQMALLADIDGSRVAFTGDAFFNTPATPDDGLRHNLIYRNDVFSGSHEQSLRNILDFEPHVVAPGHGSPFLLTRTDAERFARRLKQQQAHFESLLPGPDIDFGLDPSWVHLYPYQMRILPGESGQAEVRVRNHRSGPMELQVSLVLPESWKCEPEIARISAAGKGAGQARFSIAVPRNPGTTENRVAIAADVVADGRYLGQLAEAVVDLRRSEF
jgi:glyoxylase-like metal-dependent hydrolase (beta-lactamase superfamily II)